MELTCNHRAQLLDSLEAAQAEVVRFVDLQNTVSDNLVEDEMISERNAVEHYLALQRILTIKEALIENKIDY